MNDDRRPGCDQTIHFVQFAFARLQAYTPFEKDKTKAALERAFAVMFSTLTEEERGMLIQTAAAPGISINRKWL